MRKLHRDRLSLEARDKGGTSKSDPGDGRLGEWHGDRHIQFNLVGSTDDVPVKL